MGKPYADLHSFYKAPIALDPPDGPHPTALLGLPFDLGTEFRPGSRMGPNAVRQMSGTFTNDDHPELGLSPGDGLTVFDAGDIDARPTLPDSLKAIEAEAGRLIGAGCHLVGIGGDHTVTLPLLRATAAVHGPLALVQIDAHVDTWQPPDGLKAYHGSFVRNAIEEGIIDPAASVQIGIRSPTARDIMAWTRDHGITIVSTKEVHQQGVAAAVTAATAQVGDRPCYLTVDMDCLDPAFAPGTSTPEPGGLASWQLLALIEGLAGLNWAGMDVVEITPAYDHADITALTAANAVWSYLCGRAAKLGAGVPSSDGRR